MAPIEAQSAEKLTFGPFEVDIRTAEFFRNGRKLRLSGQSAQLLVILIQRAGQLVSREDLRVILWPEDSYGDFGHGLNNCISRIREALGDSVASPRYVETLPKQGYRFIAEVKVCRTVPTSLQDTAHVGEEAIGPVDGAASPGQLAEELSAASQQSKRGPTSDKVWLKIGAGLFAVAAIALAAVGVYRWLRPQSQPAQEQANLTAVPFTALPGQATSPAFSPDGSRIAFAWNGDPKGGAKGFDLYVKAIGSETLLRLTQQPSHWISPAWSPDGTQIAFHRLDAADLGIYVVPALGGPERKLRSTRMPVGWEPFSIISWSPDGKWIAFADVPPDKEYARVYLLSAETLEARQIPISPKCVGEGLPAFSHNGEYLAYWCFRSVNETVLYSLPIPNGEPKLISIFPAFQLG